MRTSCSFLCCKLLSSRSLRLRVEIFNLGFTENTEAELEVMLFMLWVLNCSLHPGVACSRSVYVWVADNEENLPKITLATNWTSFPLLCPNNVRPMLEIGAPYVLWPSQGDSSNSRNLLQPELRDSFPRLLLVAGMDCYRCTARNCSFSLSFTSLDLRV